MAIFGDISSIRTFIEPFTCISPSLTPYGQDKIILSESKHIAVLYDLNTCLPIKCWSFAELDPLVAPFIYDHVNEKFIAVKQLKVALYKCDSEEDLVKVRLGKIHCMLASSTKESLVLFKNGFVRSLGSVIAEKGKLPENGIIPENEEIIKTTINQFSPELSWVAILTKTQNCFAKLYMIKADFVTGEGDLDAKYTIKQNFKCLTMTKSGQPIGVTETGNIHLLSIESDEQLLSLHNSTMISALCLPEQDSLAVVVQEKKTSSVQYSLKIVNLKYKVITSQLTLDIVPLPDFLSQSNGNLFIGSRKAMLCIQYEIKPASLASVMGKNLLSKDKSSEKLPASDHIFLDSSTDTKIASPLTENITLNELKSILPKLDELLSEKAIFSALATILKSKCFSTQDTMCKEVLFSIVSRPFNHKFMVSVVKSTNLSADQFVQIIDILIEMLEIDNGFVIDWLIVILDACLKLLLFTKSDVIKNTLKKLDGKLIKMDESLGKCQEISTILDDLLTSKTELSNNSMYNGLKHDKYCIEILEL